VFALLLALGIGLAVKIHRSYVGFERIAARHVPPDATLVLRWDVEKVSLFEPTRRFLLPLFDDAVPSAQVAAAPRRDRLAKESGTMLGRDLREVLATFGPGPHDWSLLLAGSFPPGDLVAAIGRTLAQEEHPWQTAEGGKLVAPNGVALGRAGDGALVFASSRGRLDAALAIRPLIPEVPRIGAGALVVRDTSQGLPPGAAEALAPLGSVSRVEGTARWGSPLPVSVELHFEGPPPADINDRVRRAFAQLFGDDLPRLEKQFAPLSIQQAGNGAISAELLLDDPALQRAADRAAHAVERALGLGPAQE
jgi:hypothetical protein